MTWIINNERMAFVLSLSVEFFFYTFAIKRTHRPTRADDEGWPGAAVCVEVVPPRQHGRQIARSNPLGVPIACTAVPTTGSRTLTTVFSKRMVESLSTTMAPTTLPMSIRAVQLREGSGAMVTRRWLPTLTPPSASTLLCASVMVAVDGVVQGDPQDHTLGLCAHR